MAVNSVLPPYFNFRDSTGAALENGFIYVGQPGLEARTSPKASFFDIALTIPTGTASGAAIRTRGGFPVNQSRAPAMFYVDGDYSISVTDKNGVLLYSALNNTLALNVGDVGPVLWSDGDLGAVGGGFAAESDTGFVRPSAGVMQTAIAGTLGTELTTTGFRTAVPLVRTVAPTVTAGTNAQGQGPITQDFNIITTAAANPSGVTLPTAVTGRRVSVVNRGANPINVYPATGAQIGSLAVNLPWPVQVGASLDFIARSATQWDPTVGALEALADPGATLPVVWDDTNNRIAFGNPLGPQLQTAVSTASGTEVFLSGIPAWANRVTLTGVGVSLTGTGALGIQLGDSGGIEVTGYLGNNAAIVNAGATSIVAAASNFSLFLNTGDIAAALRHFTMTFHRHSGNTWAMTAICTPEGSLHAMVTTGSKTLSDALTQIRVFAGAGSFDGGTVSIAWE